MQMERERRNGSYNSCSVYDNGGSRDRESSPISSPQSAFLARRSVGYIEHPVSKFDTLAGIAIKYGVEVADIKKMNSLVTDLQMFALKSLQIPLPGRHSPSPCLTNGSITPGQSSSDHTPYRRRRSDLFESLESLRAESPRRRVSPAMSSLQGYYGLKERDMKTPPEGFEMTVYRKGPSHYLEDVAFPSTSLVSSLPLSHHRKSKSLVNTLLDGNGGVADPPDAFAQDNGSDKSSEKLFRRHRKSEADFTSPTPEMLLEDNSNSGGFFAIKGKGLALRPKAASRITSTCDAETGGLISQPLDPGDSVVADGFSGVRKSSSTPSFQDQDHNSSSSIRTTTRWSLKPDLQALSAGAIAKPIFDGLPRPTPGRRNKAALD
ncbi:hypothetical protein CJ030_MR7G011770 [Morella rubra]|uniref:LysM domain-containing protein n=1 Tax=Morella rubra TaxID=262757 RepID=A0A6A1V340_9ROSI|nr:hypothetical protein CJ030_MR7G011770 [Morella rubra]